MKTQYSESITWETVTNSEEELTIYKWVDSDGTEHCFTFEENSFSKYDKYGLRLSLLNITNSNCLEIHDKESNIKRFIKYPETTSMEQCALLSCIMDAYGNKIVFRYEQISFGRVAVTSIGIQPNRSEEIPYFEFEYYSLGNLYEIKNLANDRKVTLEYSSDFTSSKVSITYAKAG